MAKRRGRNSGFERVTASELALLLGMREGTGRNLLSLLEDRFRLKPRREKRGITYDTLAAERLLRSRRVPTRKPPSSEDWLSTYEKENDVRAHARRPGPPWSSQR